MSEKSGRIDTLKRLPFPEPGEEVVISGIAGRFPESNNLTQLQENLLNKVDLITDDGRRWKLDHPDIPQRSGKVNNVEKFDAQFFGIDFKEAHVMDPMARMLMEHTFEAIIDAGINPRHLRGTNTGVFLAFCISETEQTWLYSTRDLAGYGLTGCWRAMMVNRISQWLGCTGPSYSVDSACGSSMFAVDHAYRAIRTGECDAALVAGANLCLHPNLSRQFSLLGVLSHDGRCKTFDAAADGYCRSEAVTVLLLQKSKDAKRIYARVVYTKTNCDGYKEQGITFPSGKMQRVLLEQFYEECKVPPSSLAFVEAHGTGTEVGDPVEAATLESVFCPGRTSPLRIGAVKTNLGHCEAASGICSIDKVIIAMESGYIPPNLHYKRPREGVKALEDGRLQVITEPTPWEGGYVGINSFGFGGGNAHALLKSNPKEKINNSRPSDDMPRLVVVSGRTEEAVTTLLDNLEGSPVDVEYISLFHNIHSDGIPGHFYRGYTILPPRGLPDNKIRDVQHYSGVKRPICFVFSGIGSQWPGMGEGLLKIPIFNKAIKKCDAALKLHGVDIIDILTNKDPKIFDNILNSFVGTAVVQMGLIDVLASIGIVPDIIIGYSVGELGCAYADGCITAEQMVLAAYFQGLASIETETIRGSMKAFGNDHAKLNGQSGIENGKMRRLDESVAELDYEVQAESILANEKSCNNIAYHDDYIATVGAKLLAHLQSVIPDSKPRSKKWLSTSMPRNTCRKLSSADLCSPEYHTNSLLNSALFDGISHLIPNNAITIDIAPHNLLQTTLPRFLNEDIAIIGLTERGHKDSVEVLLRAIGKMYEVGLHPQLVNLYPSIEYPVSRGTPMISPLVRWDHSDDWFVVNYMDQEKLDSGERVIEITLENCSLDWMAGHVIDGRNLVPATGYLALIWETVGMMQGKICTEIPIVFEDLRFHRATTIPTKGSVALNIMIQKGSGRFEISESGGAVVTGFVRTATNMAQERFNHEVITDDDKEQELTSRDIYKELRLRGYQYTGLFRSLRGASLDGMRGRIAWKKNWAVFMDNMLQMRMIGIKTRGLFVPTRIQKVVIDTGLHVEQLRAMPHDDNEVFQVTVHEDLDMVVSGGIEIRGLRATDIARKKPAGYPVLENFKFVAHRDRAEVELKVVTRIATHIALENEYSINMKTIELISEADNVSPDELISPMIQDILGDLPLIRADVNVIAPVDKFSDGALPSSILISATKNLSGESGALLAVGYGLLAANDVATLELLKAAISARGFLMVREPLNVDTDIFLALEGKGFDVVLEKRTKKELIILLRKREKPIEIATVIRVNNNEFSWLPILQAALNVKRVKEGRTRDRILLVSEGDFESGLMGLVNCLRKESCGEVIQGLLIQDLHAPKFSLENPLYSEQLKLDLALNVLRSGKLWGSYQFFALDPLASKPVYHAQIIQQTRGDLSAMKWVEGIMQPSLQIRNTIKIHYSSLNFRDIMQSSGKLGENFAQSRMAQERTIGFEYSGRDVNGRAVMGLIGTGALSNLCFSKGELVWAIPDNWTLEDAATVPAVYGTAYYALHWGGRMKRGDKVLIHSGSGGVGQAAIRLALHEGCEVFTTVGTPQKREFIKNQFPQIDDDHIGNSRDTSFEQLVLRKTHGQGVDIVLNSLAEEKLLASVRCLTTGGRFLEIGKFDLAANNPLGMEPFLKGIKFHGIILDALFTASLDKRKKFAGMFTKGMESGAIKPLVRTVFPMDQVEAAFRYMATGKHIGKVIVKIRDEDDGCQPQLPLALPRYYCSEECSYVILGGLGGFGLELANWLVYRGAKKLVLTSRKGISNGYQRMRINIWESYGVAVVVVAGKDASTHEGCEAILREAIALGPVDAIFNLAVVLKDGLCENQTLETFEESFRAKAWATKQLDRLSRTLCPRLRQFVVFSSVSCGRGNAGQTNYGMANSIMERICESRKAENLPGLAVQWGAIGDVGLVAEMQEDGKELVIGGTLQQSISSCLEELDGFLQQDCPVVSSMVVAEKKAGSAGATNVFDAVVNIMGLRDTKTVSMHTPLAELGLDSMMAVEIKQTLEREYEVFLTAPDIRSLTFMGLQELSQKQAAGDINVGNNDEDTTQNLGGGLRMLISTLGTGRIIEDTCVPLVTGSQNGREEVFIIPGIEGTYTVLETLASKLKSPTTCLQLGKNFLNLESVADMADFMFPYVKARSEGRKDLVVAGYSFGSMVAIELVRRLEIEGLSCRLVLIDGSPDYIKEHVRLFLGQSDQDQIQSTILLGIMDIVAPTITKQLMTELQNLNTWEEKLGAFMKNVPEHGRLSFSTEDQRALCSSIECRVQAVLKYDCSALAPLNSPITLVKPTVISVKSTSEDYGLGLVTRGKVDICYANGDHLTMLDDAICAAAIDGELMKKVETCIPREA